MKKIVYSVLATLSGLVLLFSYKTSWNESVIDTSASTISSDTTDTSGSSGTSTADGSSSTSDDENENENENESESSDDESGEDDSSSSGTSSSGSSSSSSGSSSSSSSSSSGLADGTYTGSAINTRYGAVQVAITVSGGQITSVDVPQYPSYDRRDIEINQRALPILIDETVSAQSSSISMVSGATYTSQGYIQSLQSALDQAQQ